MMLRIILLSIWCMFSGTAAMAAREQLKLVSAEIALDEQGRHTLLGFTQALPADLESALRSRIASWEFSPLEGANGPRAAKVLLHISLGITPSGDTVSARIADAKTGALILKMPSPLYPSGMANTRHGGQVMVLLTVDGNGQFVDAEATYATNAEFKNAALKAARRVRLAPLIADGSGADLRVQLWFPTSSCFVDKSRCRRCREKPACRKPRRLVFLLQEWVDS